MGKSDGMPLFWKKCWNTFLLRSPQFKHWLFLMVKHKFFSSTILVTIKKSKPRYFFRNEKTISSILYAINGWEINVFSGTKTLSLRKFELFLTIYFVTSNMSLQVFCSINFVTASNVDCLFFGIVNERKNLYNTDTVVSCQYWLIPTEY